MEIVEARGAELFGKGNKPSRTRKRVSVNMNQEDRRGDKCGKHALEFVLQLEAKTDAWVLWPRMNENQRGAKRTRTTIRYTVGCGGGGWSSWCSDGSVPIVAIIM